MSWVRGGQYHTSTIRGSMAAALTGTSKLVLFGRHIYWFSRYISFAKQFLMVQYCIISLICVVKCLNVAILFILVNLWYIIKLILHIMRIQLSAKSSNFTHFGRHISTQTSCWQAQIQIVEAWWRCWSKWLRISLWSRWWRKLKLFHSV